MPELTVASFNTHWGVDHRARPFDVVAPCLALDADVLVLQEVWRPNRGRCYADEIAERTGATVHEAVFMSDHNSARPRHLVPPPGPPGTCGIAVLSRLPVRKATDLLLPHAQGDVIERRHSVLVTVEVGGAPITVAGMHASHRLWGSLPQVKLVDAAIAGSGHPTVIAGDFNMWGPVVGTVLRNRRRAVLGRTWPARYPHSQIDHLWITDDLTVVSGAVGPPTDSDHRPIWARLQLR